MQLKKRDKYKQLVVIKLAPVGPTKRPNNPAINDPARGKITIQRYIFFYAGVVGGKRSRNWKAEPSDRNLRFQFPPTVRVARDPKPMVWNWGRSRGIPLRGIGKRAAASEIRNA